MTLHQEKTVQSRGCLLRGFSLAELVCVVVIIGILAAIAAPRFSNSLALQRVEAAARRVVVDLALVRRQAKSSNASQTVRFDAAAGAFGWVAVLSHGYFGISATVAELEKLGVTRLEDQKAVRGK